jgi:U2-associated protein SR140
VLEKILTRIEPEKQKFVKAVADKVRDNGHGFEEMLREREAKNGKFAFLRDVDVSLAVRKFTCISVMLTIKLPDRQLPEYHLYRSYTDSRYRLPTPPPDDFTDEVGLLMCFLPPWGFPS